MLFQVNSDKSINEIDQKLQESAARHGFGVLAIHDLGNTLRKKGVALGIDCRIYEVCNPFQAKKVLEAEGAVSTALPCRISLYGTAGHYTLATLRPTEVMRTFGSPSVEPVAREVEEVIVQMMREAVGTEAGGTNQE